jgi:hypothetical protein
MNKNLFFFFKVYDGPYSTSPLLLDRYGSEPPKAIRSRSNKLFVQLSPQYYRRQDYGKKFTARYITVRMVKHIFEFLVKKLMDLAITFILG